MRQSKLTEPVLHRQERVCARLALTCVGAAQVNPALEDAEYKNANGNSQVNPGKADMADHTPATTGANKV